MRHLPWIVFSKTGNIEAYLLMKDYEMEMSEENKLTDALPLDETDQNVQGN